MKKASGKAGRVFKAFFSSIGADIRDAFKNHWLAILGMVSMVVVPVAFIIYVYLQKAPGGWGLPVFVWIPLIVFALVYWTKLRTWLAIKVSAMKVENSIEKGKHGALIVLLDLLRGLMVFLPFQLGESVCKAVESAAISMGSVFAFMKICAAVGVVLITLDNMKNRLKVPEEEGGGEGESDEDA